MKSRRQLNLNVSVTRSAWTIAFTIAIAVTPLTAWAQCDIRQDNGICATAAAGTLWHGVTEIQAGQEVRARFEDLTGLPGRDQVGPDPELVVTQFDGEALDGEMLVVAYDDDSGQIPMAPEVAFQAPVSGNYAFFVVDINDNATDEDGNGTLEPDESIQPDDQSDFDDWKQILSYSKRSLFDQKYYDRAALYASGFNVDSDRVQDDGTCAPGCMATADAESTMSWQPDVAVGAGVTFDPSPFAGMYGHWLLFDGSGNAELVLGPNQPLEAMGNHVLDPAVAYPGFTFSAWVRRNSTDENQAIVTSDLFSVYLLENGAIPGEVYVIVWIANGEGVTYLASDSLPWNAGQQRRLHLQYDHDGGSTDPAELTVFVSPVLGPPLTGEAGGAARDRIAAMPSETFRVDVPQVVPGASVGAIRLGASDRALYEAFDGWMDDVALFRGVW